MTNPWEFTAVLLAIAYLALAIRESVWCWPAAIGSTAIYLFLMYHAQLYMESVLQIFYLAIAVYGWRSWWQADKTRGTETSLHITTWPWTRHLVAVAAVLGLAGLTGTALSQYTDAALPYLDSFTTWGAMLTTWMVARKILENWIYWLVVDGLSIYLYLSRELYLTAALFVLYLVMVVFGFFAWRRRWQAGKSGPAHEA